MDNQQKSTTFTYKKKKEVKNASLTAKILFTQKNREFVDKIFTNKEREKILFFCETIALYG